ncbi:hypothetical protein EB820_03900 [Brevibacillus agri]|uniref:Uncharacterized protein n=1 Tax=Brevibacillus agri TaxID=51101 RepID=A0A3M8B974_9BACL|nr:hypothetical protein BA6348_20615 [Brevibacillus agri]RNB59930.1 hypothetical protein EB820_03900 [Brevibacillus agri]
MLNDISIESIIRIWQRVPHFFSQTGAVPCPFGQGQSRQYESWGGAALETLYKVLIGLCVVFIAAGIYYLS